MELLLDNAGLHSVGRCLRGEGPDGAGRDVVPAMVVAVPGMC